MAIFLYKAVDQSGNPARGQLEAFNDIDLELRLKHIGLDLVRFRPARTRHRLLGRMRVSLQDLVMFCFQMEQLTRAGVPVLQGLADLRDGTAQETLRATLGQLVSAVEGGLMLSEAMAQHPEVFNRVFVSLVKAGEKTGKLADVFEHLAATLKWQDELIAQTRRLLAYPLFVMAVVLAATAFLMTYLVPQMAGFLANMGQEIPLQTRIMVSLSHAVVAWWWLFLSLPALAGIGVAVAVQRIPAARYRFDHLLLHLPLVGGVMQKIIMARFARYFALMYRSGIPILDAIKICEGIVDNRVVAEGLERAGQQINAGDSMHASFHNLGLFPPLVVRMIDIGESTRSLDAALLNISYFYDRDVRDSVEKLLKMLEPALTVMLGALLALIMFSVLGPVYDSMTRLKF